MDLAVVANVNVLVDLAVVANVDAVGPDYFEVVVHHAFFL